MSDHYRSRLHDQGHERPFALVRNDDFGVVHSRSPVRFRVTDATAGTECHGHLEIASSRPPSGGLPYLAHCCRTRGRQVAGGGRLPWC